MMTIIEVNPIIVAALILAFFGVIAAVVVCEKNAQKNERELRRKQPLLEGRRYEQ